MIVDSFREQSLRVWQSKDLFCKIVKFGFAQLFDFLVPPPGQNNMRLPLCFGIHLFPRNMLFPNLLVHLRFLDLPPFEVIQFLFRA
jgi:hypothetical protein